MESIIAELEKGECKWVVSLSSTDENSDQVSVIMELFCFCVYCRYTAICEIFTHTLLTNILQAVIHATSINLWTIDKEVLKMDIKNLLYPPSFQVDVLGRTATEIFFLKIRFKISENKKEDFFMTLPLDLDMQGDVYT